METIFDYVKEQRTQYRAYTIEIADGYDYSQYQTLRTIELYHNSKFETGNRDSLKREKPFYNITKFRVNVAVRATDMDTKDIQVISERPGASAAAEAFLLSLKNRNWMKQTNFGVFLNKFGHTRAKYGGVLVKKTERNGELSLHIPEWRNMITDQVDIRNGVKIERHYYTPAQLQEQASAGWTNIDEAITTARRWQEATAGKAPSRMNRTPGNYIEVFEVHGVLPDKFLTEEQDQEETAQTYSRQMHIVVLDESDKADTKGVTLFAGLEDEDPYKYLPYEEVEGRGLGVGVVEDVFEAQVWTNYTVKQKKDLLDLAGKIIFQTSDSSLAAKNVLTDIEQGTILQTAPNQPITQINNQPIALNGIAQLMSDWDTQAQNVTSTFPAILGSTPPHGTSFRLMATLTSEATALFDYRRQEAGLFIQEMYRDWILPFIVKQMAGQKDLIGDLDPQELEMLSNAVAEDQAVSFAKQQLLPKATNGGKAPLGKLVRNQDILAIKQAAKNATIKKGKRHAFSFVGDTFSDWKGSIDVNTTGENDNTKDTLATLFQLFGVVAQNPTLLQNPTLAGIFNNIIEIAGVSPSFMQPNPSSVTASTPSAPAGNQPPVTEQQFAPASPLPNPANNTVA